ncbi:membrane protein YdbS with pleckstrin-like domain [Rathayibacter agropyri]
MTAGRSRRTRTVRESLGSIVLGFEAVIVVLATLVGFGLKVADPVVVLVSGAVLCLALVATVGLLNRLVGFRVGWVLQFVIVASGLLVPIMYVVGGAFVALWTYCMVTGTRLDAQTRRAAEPTDPTEGDR